MIINYIDWQILLDISSSAISAINSLELIKNKEELFIKTKFTNVSINFNLCHSSEKYSMVIELLTVRAPAIADLEDIVHLNRVSLPENYPVAYFIELIKSWHETSCVAIADNKVVGYIITRIEKASITPWRPRGKSQAHIISVAVSPDQRRQGIGNKMMSYITDRVNEIGNIEKITLEVRESNVSAIEMYRNLKYLSAKILDKYYSDGESALLMELKL